MNGGYQDDKYGNGNRNQRFGDRRSADGIPKPEGMSPDNQKGVGSSTAAIVPSVRDNISTSIPLPRIEPPKVGGVKVLDSSTKGNVSLFSLLNRCFFLSISGIEPAVCISVFSVILICMYLFLVT